MYSSKNSMRARLVEEDGSVTPLPAGGDEQAVCSASLEQEAGRPPLPGPQPSAPQPTPAVERERPRPRSPREQGSAPWRSQAAAKRSRLQQSDAEERLLDLLQDPPRPQSALDECYHFALSIVPLLLRMDPVTRQQAKIDTLITLKSYVVDTAPPPGPASPHQSWQTPVPTWALHSPPAQPRPGTRLSARVPKPWRETESTPGEVWIPVYGLV